MAGALSGENWLDVAKSQRVALLLELDGFSDLKKMFEDADVGLDI